MITIRVTRPYSSKIMSYLDDWLVNYVLFLPWSFGYDCTCQPVNIPSLGLILQPISQVCPKWVAIWLLDFLKTHAILTRLVVVSIQVRENDSIIPCGVDTGHGPIRSAAVSFQWASAISQSGRKLWPGPEGLVHWHLSHTNSSICKSRYGWWYWACSVAFMHPEPSCPSMTWDQL